MIDPSKNLAKLEAADAVIADLRSQLSQSKGEVERLRSAQAWLPIESAPKDNSWILGLMRTRRQAVVRSAGGGCWEDDSRLIRDPTHWLPLPSPPSAKEAGA